MAEVHKEMDKLC